MKPVLIIFLSKQKTSLELVTRDSSMEQISIIFIIYHQLTSN